MWLVIGLSALAVVVLAVVVGTTFVLLRPSKKERVLPSPTMSASTSTSGSPAPYHKVDDLCQVTKFDGVGKVKANTATHRNDAPGNLLSMDCVVEIESQSSTQLQKVIVIATLNQAGGSMRGDFATELSHASQASNVSNLGEAAFFQPAFNSGPRLMTYEANLMLSVIFTYTSTAGLPDNIPERLKSVASSALDGLRTH